MYRRSDLLTTAPTEIQHIAKHAKPVTKQALSDFFNSPDGQEHLRLALQHLCDTVAPQMKVSVKCFTVPYLAGINKLAKRAVDELGMQYQSENLCYLILETEPGGKGVGHFMVLTRRAQIGKDNRMNEDNRMIFFESFGRTRQTETESEDNPAITYIFPSEKMAYQEPETDTCG